MERFLNLMALVLFATICFMCGHHAGKRYADRWWVNRITGKEAPVPGSMWQDDDYCVRIKDYGGDQFIAQPVQCPNVPLVEERPGESRESVFARCGDVGPCDVIFHNELIDSNEPVEYRQRCRYTTNGIGSFDISPDGHGFPCIVVQ